MIGQYGGHTSVTEGVRLRGADLCKFVRLHSVSGAFVLTSLDENPLVFGIPCNMSIMLVTKSPGKAKRNKGVIL